MIDFGLRAVVIVAALFAGASHARSMEPLHSERSLYREVLVYENAGVRCMCFTRQCRIGRQSCMDMKRPDRMVMHYPQMMMGALYVKPAPRSVLIIGLGGGTIPRALVETLPEVQIDVVEIDPAVVRVARQYFDFSEGERMRVHVLDGRVYVKQALREARRYDLVMLDAFDHEYIPEHLLTREFLTEVKTLLAPRRRARREHVLRQPALSPRIEHLRRGVSALLQSQARQQGRHSGEWTAAGRGAYPGEQREVRPGVRTLRLRRGAAVAALHAAPGLEPTSARTDRPVLAGESAQRG